MNTVRDAQATLGIFRSMIPSDGSPRFEAMIKTKLVDGENEAFIWLANTCLDGDAFLAEIFEKPQFFPNVQHGQRFRVDEKDLVDWMVPLMKFYVMIKSYNCYGESLRKD